MEDEAIITDTDLEQTTGPRGADDDDISVEIMDCYGVVQSVVDVLSREAVLPCTFQDPMMEIIFAARRSCQLLLPSSGMREARHSRARPPDSPRGSAKSVVGGLMSGVVGVLARVRRGPVGTMGSA